MPSPTEYLTTRRDSILAEIAALLASPPDYSIQGQSVQWVSRRKALYEELKDINELMTIYDPFEITTVAV